MNASDFAPLVLLFWLGVASCLAVIGYALFYAARFALSL